MVESIFPVTGLPVMGFLFLKGNNMEKALFAIGLVLLCSCHAGIHIFKSDNGMMIQELEAAKITEADFEVQQ